MKFSQYCLAASVWAPLLDGSSVDARAAEALTFENPRFVGEGPVIETIDLQGVFQVTMPGTLVVDVVFQSDSYCSEACVYELPEKAVRWSVSNALGEPLGDRKWYGEGPLEFAQLPVLEFEPRNGRTLAQLELPIGLYRDHTDYPFLPDGGVTIDVILGDSSELAPDRAGEWIGVSHDGALSFGTVHPAVMLLLYRELAHPGEEVLIELQFDEPLPADEVFEFEIVGPGGIALEGADSDGWSSTLRAGADRTFLSTTAVRPGPYRVRARGSDGIEYESPRGRVLPFSIDFAAVGGGTEGIEGVVESAAASGASSGVFEGGDGVTLKFYNDLACKHARAAQLYTECYEYNCTPAYVELIEDPPNPDCKGAKIGLYYPGRCVHQELKYCSSNQTTVPLTVQVYKYDTTVVKEVGKTFVRGKLSAGGKLVKIIDIGAEVEGGVETKLLKKCCKASPTGKLGIIQAKDCVGDSYSD